MDNAKLPLVSVIVVAYNSEAWIGECLDSVLAQTYPNWECVVVDDGSTDGTYAIAESYAKRDSRIRCLRQENQGPSVARNTAVAHSHGEYILPLDADDMIASQFVENAVQYHESHPETTIVCGNVMLLDNGKTISGGGRFEDYNYNDFIWGRYILPCSAMYHRTDFDRIGGYNPDMRMGLEDWDFWLSLLTKDSKVHCIDEVGLIYRMHEGSRTTTTASQHLKQLRRMICLNHPDIYAPYAQDILHIVQEAEQEKRYWQHEAEARKNSRAYRLGRYLLKPLSFFKRI